MSAGRRGGPRERSRDFELTAGLLGQVEPVHLGSELCECERHLETESSPGSGYDGDSAGEGELLKDVRFRELASGEMERMRAKRGQKSVNSGPY